MVFKNSNPKIFFSITFFSHLSFHSFFLLFQCFIPFHSLLSRINTHPHRVAEQNALLPEVFRQTSMLSSLQQLALLEDLKCWLWANDAFQSAGNPAEWRSNLDISNCRHSGWMMRNWCILSKSLLLSHPHSFSSQWSVLLETQVREAILSPIYLYKSEREFDNMQTLHRIRPREIQQRSRCPAIHDRLCPKKLNVSGFRGFWFDHILNEIEWKECWSYLALIPWIIGNSRRYT
jgi:hypothetical protein